MKTAVNRKSNYSFSIIAIGIFAATLLVLLPSNHRYGLGDAVRAKEYTSVHELKSESSNVAVLSQVSNGRKEHIRDFDYDVADFQVLSSDQRGATLTVLLPTDKSAQRSIRGSKILAFLSPLTFGDSVSYDRFVFVGDGAGIFVADGASGRFLRSDAESGKLPAWVTTQQLNVSE